MLSSHILLECYSYWWLHSPVKHNLSFIMIIWHERSEHGCRRQTGVQRDVWIHIKLERHAKRLTSLRFFNFLRTLWPKLFVEMDNKYQLCHDIPINEQKSTLIIILCFVMWIIEYLAYSFCFCLVWKTAYFHQHSLLRSHLLFSLICIKH